MRCSVKDHDPARALLKLPAKAGDSWDSAPPNAKVGGEAGDVRKVAGVEEVTVPAGTFKAIRVDVTRLLAGKQFIVSQWYAPDIGPVKTSFQYGDALPNVISLKKFTPGK